MDANGLFDRLKAVPVARVSGKVTAIRGMLLEAAGVKMPVGELCRIQQDSGQEIEAEVVGFNDKSLFLMSLSNRIEGVSAGNRILPVSVNHQLTVGRELLGRVVDALGNPLDDRSLSLSDTASFSPPPMNPLQRTAVDQPLMVGVRAIDGLLTLGQGQRVGLFAGSGVGKSTLLGMMTRNTQADVTVVGLIGERSREVREFVDHTLGAEGLSRAVVVAAPGDESPIRRIRAALYCHRIAEYFRDQGKSVLLLMDSLSRFAQAQREVALAAGESPASRGYPPSVFSKIPLLLERAGPGVGKGSITAVYTVLADGDDMKDPVVDSARSILDGHIVLSRELAERGHYPAIDLEQSLSRVMPQVTSQRHQCSALQFRRYHARYNEFRELLAIGAYQEGADRELDRAIEQRPMMEQFLQQSRFEQVDSLHSIQQLESLWQPEERLQTVESGS